MFKIAIDSGHGLMTSGKEVPSYMGKGKIKEWELNNRITNELIYLLEEYKDVEILRLDDETGKRDVPLQERCNKANNWGPDLVLSNHHNAGINGGKGGGLCIFRYTNSKLVSHEMCKRLYDCIIKYTGLEGNRATPINERSNLKILNGVKAPAILIEHGFMDSTTDLPIILKDDFPIKSAIGIVEWLENEYGLERIKDFGNTRIVYRVQVGAFYTKGFAENLKKELEKLGYDPIIAQGRI